MKDYADTLVLGAGLSGLSAALQRQRTGREVLVVERANQVGGLCITHHEQGFHFDLTGHWLHLRNPGVMAMVPQWLDNTGLLRIERVAKIYSHQTLTDYPFQANTHGLPPQVVKDCLLGFIKAHTLHTQNHHDPPPMDNFEEFILARLGEGIAEHFMVPYNAKLWGVHPREMSAKWCDRFVPLPNLEEVVAGAVGCDRTQMGYNATFLYPASGGIGSLAKGMAKALKPGSLRLGTEAISIDANAHQVRLNDGSSIGYRRLISTLPLPHLAKMVDGPGNQTDEAAVQDLRWTGVPYINMGVRGPVNRGAHWIYFPEKEFPFYRVGSYSNAAPYMAPKGCGSLYIEMADRDFLYSRDMPMVRQALVKAGLITSIDDIMLEMPGVIPVAYVVFDHNYQASRLEVLGKLAAMDMISIGRYGDWTYNAMEDAILDGIAIAD